MKKLLLFLASAMLAVPAFAANEGFNTFVSGLSNSTTLAGTELLPCVQGGSTTKCTPAQISAYVAANATIPLANIASIQPNTVLGNYDGSAAAPVQLGPGSLIPMMSAVVAVDYVATANVTASGVQTVDGQATGNGQFVLLTFQTSNVNNGIYVTSSSGAWSRATNFPNGLVLQQSCEFVVLVKAGTANAGGHFSLSTSSASITVGTSGQTWTGFAAGASSVRQGTTFLSSSNASYAVPTSNGATTAYDCVDWRTPNSTGGSTDSTIEDDGNTAGDHGPCVVADAHGNPILDSLGDGVVVSGTGCTAATGVTMRNATGAITATGVDTCTLTFGDSFTTQPNCTVSGVGATVIPYLNALPSTTAAVFKTTAAGTFTYTCF